MRKAAWVGSVLCLATVAVWAGPLGTSFRVSSCTTCRQEIPAVAGSKSGGFLAIWEGKTVADPLGISGRLYTSAGTPQAADFAVAKDVTPDQYDAAVTLDSKGNYVAVWSAVAAGNSEIIAQRFQSNGAPLGAAFKVNQDAAGTPTIPADYKPAVAPTGGSGFVVAWLNLLPASSTFQGTPPQVLARRFDSSGKPIGTQIKLNTGLVNDARPEVCVDTSGKIITVWTSVDRFRPFLPSKYGISMRRLSAAGAPLAAEEVVAPPISINLRPAVSCGNGSTFVVVWHSELAPAQVFADILGQRFSRQGRKIGAAFRINTVTTGEQRNPSISHDKKGNFVVVWQTSTGPNLGLSGRRFTAAGAATGPEFEVFSDPFIRPLNPRVAHVGTAGNFVAVWQDTGRKIFARRFTP